MQKYIAFFDEIVPAQLNVDRYFVNEDYKEKTANNTIGYILYKRLILDDEENFISEKMQKYIVFFDEIVPAQLNVDRYFVNEDYKEKTAKLILDDEENFISEKMQKYIAFFDEIVPAQLNVNRYFVDEDYKEKTQIIINPKCLIYLLLRVFLSTSIPS
ncbi:hypothetical protein RhiirC2_796445 [Rhizophagus irregularis]|uniref:Uncharacterized protein n=1 Tax=Rhizophagus irregularis TaxID=588596 RepID=A0A2N1M9R0_9GLOM|nr:hypothetical protein RhiirC2_796445 [Rhizophagus irregularis]